MKDEEMFAIMDGMEEVNRQMAAEIEAAAPMCHFRKMSLEAGDAIEGPAEEWWECDVCGHTKPV